MAYTVTTDKLDALYKRLKPKGVTMTGLLAKAAGVALAQHPLLFAGAAALDCAGSSLSPGLLLLKLHLLVRLFWHQGGLAVSGTPILRYMHRLAPAVDADMHLQLLQLPRRPTSDTASSEIDLAGMQRARRTRVASRTTRTSTWRWRCRCRMAASSRPC